jgi:FkbM family methyltransferase
MARVLLWQARKRVGQVAEVEMLGGYRLRVHPGCAAASLALYTQGIPDYPEMKLMQRYLRPGDTFLDVGANVGSYTLVAAAMVGREGHVHAFEPSGEALPFLKENIELNGLGDLVSVHEVAASEDSGEVSFATGRDTQNRIQPAGSGSSARITVPTERVDRLVSSERLALGKIDVEGAEAMVLRGCTELLEHGCPPIWILELNKSLTDYGDGEAGLEAWLAERGYRLAMYDEVNERIRFERNLWLGAQNVLAVATDRREEINERLATAKAA